MELSASRRPALLPYAGAAAAGLALDALVGEPPAALHPVAAFGQAMGALERRCYAPRRSNGVLHAALGVGLGATAGRAVGRPALATAVCVAGRCLWDTALHLASHLEAGRLEDARAGLCGLVGRDGTDLDAKEMSRAVVESVAENTVDAIVAPALWAAALGAPGAGAYRAVNTLDAMVGHRTARYERYGWASAHLDDLAGFVPARVTAALVALCRPATAGEILRCLRRQAPAHPSPNAGVAEAAFAAALGLRLGGVNRYHGRSELRPELGVGRVPEPGDVAGAVALSRQVTFALGAGLGLVGAVRAWRRP